MGVDARPDGAVRHHRQGRATLVFTEEQSKLYGELQPSVLNTADEWFANFVIGNADIDADWDTYLATLNDAGLDRFLEIYQTAYDAKYK